MPKPILLCHSEITAAAEDSWPSVAKLFSVCTLHRPRPTVLSNSYYLGIGDYTRSSAIAERPRAMPRVVEYFG